jgi:Hint domain
MTTKLDNSNSGPQRTRRNIIKMGAILGAVALGRVHSAAAHGLGSGSGSSPLGSLLSNLNNFVAGLLGNVPTVSYGRSNCFLKGTKIETAEGERRIEDLVIGDRLPTMFGGMRPIQWIGRYPIKKSDPSKPWVRDALPVRIAASALAPNVPHAELYVTGGHSLMIDGLLVPAGCLINGETITRHETANECDELEFFHIKLESHDVIYAEGAPVDTLLRVDECAVNFADYFRRYGQPTIEETRCAPRVSFGGGRGEMTSRMRSALSPWLDRRTPLDLIRDRLEERAILLSRQAELVG